MCVCVAKTQQASPLHIKSTECGGVIVFYDCLKWPIVKVNDPNGLINNFILLFSRHNSVDGFVVSVCFVYFGCLLSVTESVRTSHYFMVNEAIRHRIMELHWCQTKSNQTNSNVITSKHMNKKKFFNRFLCAFVGVFSLLHFLWTPRELKVAMPMLNSPYKTWKRKRFILFFAIQCCAVCILLKNRINYDLRMSVLSVLLALHLIFMIEKKNVGGKKSKKEQNKNRTYKNKSLCWATKIWNNDF